MTALLTALAAALIATGGANAPSSSPGDDGRIAILITGQNRGVFEPCGCHAAFRGGLVRRATAFRNYRSRYGSLIAIDTGDQPPQFTPADEFGPMREVRDRTDAAIMDGMKQLNYDAVLVGDLDLDWGVARYRSLTHDLPMIAANLFDDVGRLGGTARIVETPAARVGIIGVVDPEALALLRPEIRARLRVTDPIAAARDIAADFSESCDLVVAVTIGGAAFDAELARAVPAIDVIVSQFGHGEHETYDADAEAIRVVSPRNGLEVAVLELTLDAQKHVASRKTDTLLIEPSIPREKHLAEVFSALDYDTDRLTLWAEQNLRPISITSADDCRECHAPQYDFWRNHPHADAMNTLAEANRPDDPLCVGCHTTGYGFDGGFVDLVTTPQLAGVSCTACHVVDLAAHVSPQRPPVPKVPEDTCLICHTRRDSPRFEAELDIYLADGRCPPSPHQASAE